MKKILIIKLGALGDVIFAEGAIRDIQQHHPHDEITLLTSPFFARLLASHPAIHRLEIDHRRPRWDLWYLYTLIRRLRGYGYDQVYDLQNNSRTNLYQMLMLSTPWSGKAWLASHRYIQQDAEHKNRQDYLSEQLQLAGVPTYYCHRPNWLWLQQPVHDLLQTYGLAAGFILMLPGCSKRHPEKRWPGYVALANRLTQQGYTVVCAPGPDEMDVLASMPGLCLLDQGKPLSIPQLIGLAQHAWLVIGNDSGPTHLLARCQTRGIGIFQKARYVADSGIANYYTVLQQDNLENLSVDAVLAKALALLTTQVEDSTA